jgi:hypothetical protein
MGIDESRHYNSPPHINNFCVANILFDLIAWTNSFDLAVADEHSAVANNREFRHLRTNARALCSRQRDNLRGVEDGE